MAQWNLQYRRYGCISSVCEAVERVTGTHEGSNPFSRAIFKTIKDNNMNDEDLIRALKLRNSIYWIVEVNWQVVVNAVENLIKERDAYKEECRRFRNEVSQR